MTSKGKRKVRTRKQLLSLTTATEQLFITIDDVHYDLVTQKQTGVLDQHRASEALRDLGEPGALTKALDAEDYAQAQEILDRITVAQNVLVTLALPTLPDELLEELDMTMKGQIIRAFLGMASSQTPTEPESPESRQTGGNGSPDSSDSTEPESPPSG